MTGPASPAATALPHVVAPASGRLVNANERVAPPDFPVFLGRDWFDDARRAAHPRIAGPARPHAPDDFAAMQVDDGRPRRPRPAAAPARRAGARRPARRALALLAGWDGSMATDAPQPLIFNAWMQRLYRDILARAGVPPGAEAAAAPWTQLVPFALVAAGRRALRRRLHRPAARRAGAGDGRARRALRRRSRQMAVGRRAPGGVRQPDPARHSAARAGDETPHRRARRRFHPVPRRHAAAARSTPCMAPRSATSTTSATSKAACSWSRPGQSGHLLSPLARNFLQRWRDGAMITIAHAPASGGSTPSPSPETRR